MTVGTPDWRDAAAYDRLLPGDRRCFAWEWLRRTEGYQEVWARLDAPRPFGLERLENPALDAISARPIWAAEIDRAVIRAAIRPSTNMMRLFPTTTMPLMTVAAERSGVTPVLFSDGLRSIRIDLRDDAILSASEPITWHIAGMTDIEPRVSALAQITALHRLGRFSRELHPPERRARRWIAMLRVHDALRAGAHSRAIVAELFQVPTADPRWRTTAAPWRLRVQRLASGARKLAASAATLWLDPNHPM